jgi:signal transduction histidine kinase
MSSELPDPKWPRLLSLAVHEFRTPLSVGAGYIRMMLTGRAGEVSPQQRRMLEEAEKACARVTALVAEMSDLANLEAGTATANRSTVDLRTLLRDAITALPPVPEGEVDVKLTTGTGPARMQCDPGRLTTALTSIVKALRRELVASPTLFVRESERNHEGRPASWIAIGDAEHIDGLAAATAATLTTFDEWRGGCGLGLAIARRIIGAHGGAVWSPGDGARAGAVIRLPH